MTSGYIPVVRTRAVFHIGAMTPKSKANRFSNSLEGHCLSVSRCPVAWRQIAKLGGFPLWELKRLGYGTFIDVHKAGQVESLRSEIERWGFDNQLVERKPRWHAWTTDEEGEWRYCLCASEQEARDQLCEEDFDRVRPDGKPVIEPVTVLIATDRLTKRLNNKRMDDQDAFDMLAVVWADDTQPSLDGAWWQDVYDPDRYSAPRGGIFPSRLYQWARQESTNWEDDEEGVGLRFGAISTNHRYLTEPETLRDQESDLVPMTG